MAKSNKAEILRYYDTHPINEEGILAKLAARGTNLDALTQDELKDFDQDHYGGVGAVDLLASRAGIRPEHHVLDVCSGMGGPARWLAHRVGCRVTGLDLTASRVESARRLSRRVGLDRLVDFVAGDATAMPLPDRTYDAVIGQEAFVHVPDRPALIAECVRVVKPGGAIAFTDIVARAVLGAGEASKLTWAIQAAEAVTPQRYLDLLGAHGCAIEHCEDLSDEWTGILAGRLAMYRSLRDTTVARFGEAHYEDWDRRYSYFVGLYQDRRLGGVRIVARRPAT
jgi:ubiquinone/menaquinone biosynthesis C-methylase UbiE